MDPRHGANVPIAEDALTTLKPQPLAQISGRIRDGDLLLCSGNDSFSRLIGWATKSPWTHIAIAYRWPQIGRIMVFESVKKIGVRTVPLESFIARSSDGKEPYPGKILLARHERMAAKLGHSGSAAAVRLADVAVDRFGDPFAAREILRIGLRIMLGAANARMPKSLGPRNEFICSEYVGRCMEALDIQIPWDGKGFIAPSDFACCPEVHALAQLKTR
jgi:hypothetical protein